jgi:RND superfamily putative drug exporter
MEYDAAASPAGSPVPATTPRPATVRLATWSARHRWLVLSLWFATTIGGFAINAAMGGMRVVTADESPAGIGESATGQRVFDGAGSRGSSQPFELVITSAGSLDTPEGRASIAAITGRLEAGTVELGGRLTALFDVVSDPFAVAAADPAAGSQVISPDRKTVLVLATVSGAIDEVKAKVTSAENLLGAIRAQNPDLRIFALNTTVLQGELIDYAGGSTLLLLLVTLPLTLLILLVAFRAAVAAFIPLVLGLTAIVGGMAVVGLYSRAVGPVSPFASEFVVLIGLAVAVDYSLFVVTRFRSERASGHGRLEAVAISSATAGRAVFFSGLAVAISMASLFLLDDPLVASFAVGSIAAVLVSVVGTMTFLPATLALLDRHVDSGKLPFLRTSGDVRGGWSWFVRRATERPILVAVVSVAILLAAAAPIANLRLGYVASDFSVMPADLEVVAAARTIGQAWPAGSSMTLDVVVTNADKPPVQDAIERLEAAALRLTGVRGPARTTPSADGTAVRVSFPLAGGPNDPTNAEIVRKMRSQVVPAAFAAVAGSRAYVAGDAAFAADYGSFYASKALLVICFVLGLSFLLLLVAFRSIAIPIKAILLDLLSFASTFGIMVLIFHGGSGVIDASNPVMIFAILFGLSMDYHVFILSRVKEARDAGLSSAEAVVTGISSTSGTVTSAAAIMVCVFAGFGTIGIANIQQFGVGMAVAVFIDATLVRSLLLPATMRLLGDWNWWLPRFLAWLPRLSVEGELGADNAADRLIEAA